MQFAFINYDGFVPESCGFRLARGQAVWNNGGDCDHLYDAVGNQVSQMCYQVSSES